MKHIIYLAFLCLCGMGAAGQLVQGKVIDANTREPLQGASINTTGGLILSKSDGSFTLRVGTQEINVSFAGYLPLSMQWSGSNRIIELKKNDNSLGEVVVSANRTAQSRREAPLAITVLSKQALAEAKATTLDQVLNKVSGVNMVNLGNEQHEMSIRQPMTTKSLFLYLEDGIPIRTTGLYNHNALLEMNQTAIKQIEVIKGPASSFYGAEAIGGVVNVLTQAPPAIFTGMAGVQVNNNGYKRIDMQAGGSMRKFGLLISGYYANRHNGPVDHSDFHKAAITIRGDYRLSEKMKWTNSLTYVSYYSDMLGTLDSIHFAQHDYSTPHTFTYRKVPSLRFTSRLSRQWNANSETQLSLVYRNNTVEQNPSYRVRNAANDPSLAYGEINASDFHSWLAIAQHQQKISFLNSKLITGVSADASPSRYNSRYLLIQRDDRGYYTSYTEPDSTLSRYRTNILNLASFVHYEMAPFKGWKFSAALRYDYYHYDFLNYLLPSAFSGAPSDRQPYHRLSPRLGFTYNYKGVGWYANYSEGFVPPQVSDLFTGVKVPFLQSQTFFNYEIGGWLSLFGNKLYADWSLYLLNGTNEIITVRNPDGSLENQNAGRTRHQGLEYGITYRPASSWSFRISGAQSQHRFIHYVEKGIAYDKNELPGGPHTIINAECSWKPSFLKGFRISSEWQHIGSYFMDNANSKKYGGYDLLNLRAGFTRGAWDVWINFLNATNRYYSTYASKSGNTISYATGDPRELMVGLAYRFGTKTDH